MQLKLSFFELEQLISEKTGKELPICYGGPHTVRITHKIPLMGSVGLDITVESITGTDVLVSFSGGAGIEFMLKTALAQAQKQNPNANLVKLIDGNKLQISLGQGSGMSSLFDSIILRDIHFDEQSVMIDFIPRNIPS